MADGEGTRIVQKLSPDPGRPSLRYLNLAVVCLFALLLYAFRPAGGGVDLTSSYLGCRVIMEHNTDHLYSQDVTSYQLVKDPVWQQATLGRGFAPDLALPPYVQTPLWGYSLRPLCRSMGFPAFNRLFLFVLCLCFAGTVWLTAREWTLHLFHPLWVAASCVLYAALYPLHYSLALTQTHILFLYMALLAVALARRGFPIWAGILLALAAAVKITPALLFVYWIITRQKKAAWSFIAASLALVAAAVLTTGAPLYLAYLRSMSRVSNMLLVAWNNQSLAAWWMGFHYPRQEFGTWHIFVLPPAVKITSLVLLLASAVAGGFFDRRRQDVTMNTPPYGAIFTLTGATLFTPIAWTHYFVILIVPIMFLLDAFLRRRSPILLAVAAAIVLPNVYHFVFRLSHAALPDIVRLQFYSGIVAMAALYLLSRPGGLVQPAQEPYPHELHGNLAADS